MTAHEPAPSLLSSARRLRTRLESNEILVLPGVYDCITARSVQRHGFDAAYMTGAGTAATLGFPDYGLLSFEEMLGNVRRIAGVLDIPLIADADTGFGNELNVVRTVREYERAGAAGLHIEDQQFPKKCGHLDSKTVIALDEFLPKIRAAVHARRSPDFLIIARTDARAVLGFDEAIARARAAIAAGADMAFVEAPETLEEALAVPGLVGAPCLLNMVWGGKTPDLSFAEAEAAGYRMMLLPGLMLAGTIGGTDMLAARTLAEGRHAALGERPKGVSFSRFGADEWDRESAALAAIGEAAA